MLTQLLTVCVKSVTHHCLDMTLAVEALSPCITKPKENTSSSSRPPDKYCGVSFIVIFHKQYKPPVTPNIIMLICINYIYVLEYS